MAPKRKPPPSKLGPTTNSTTGTPTKSNTSRPARSQRTDDNSTTLTDPRLSPHTASLHPPPPPNLYPSTHPIDFTSLALTHPGFASVLKPRSTNQIDFSDPHAVRQLTYALLARDFALQITLPPNRLCPAVPGRWGYVCWVRALVEGSRPLHFTPQGRVVEDEDENRAGGDQKEEADGGSDDDDDDDDDDEAYKKRQITGIDIGTGASAIYPLLLLRSRPNYRMLATEIDAVNLRYARENVARNGAGLASRCRVVEAEGALAPAEIQTQTQTQPQPQIKAQGPGIGNDSEAWLIPVKELQKLAIHKVDFTMTNPPFYVSEAEMLESAKLKKRPPGSSCTGAPVEMIYPAHTPASASAPAASSLSPDSTQKAQQAQQAHQPNEPRQDGTGQGETQQQQGGEVAFIQRLMRESVLLRDSGDAMNVQVRWFTTLLGKKSSLTDHLLPYLVDELGCKNYVVGEITAGTGRTRRWGLGWCWGGWRAGSRRGVGGVEEGHGGGGASGVEKRLLPEKGWSQFEVEGGRVGEVGSGVDEVVEELELDGDDDEEHEDEVEGKGQHKVESGGKSRDGVRWLWKPQKNEGVGVCWKGDCWSRKARRARELERRRRREAGAAAAAKDGNGDGDGDVEMEGAEGTEGAVRRQDVHEEPKLVFRITVKESEHDPSSSTVMVRWLCGTDAVLFESFCGWLKRKMRQG